MSVEAFERELTRVHDITEKQGADISVIREELGKLQEMSVYMTRELDRLGACLKDTDNTVNQNKRKITVFGAIVMAILFILSNLDKLIHLIPKGD